MTTAKLDWAAALRNHMQQPKTSAPMTQAGKDAMAETVLIPMVDNSHFISPELMKSFLAELAKVALDPMVLTIGVDVTPEMDNVIIFTDGEN